MSKMLRFISLVLSFPLWWYISNLSFWRRFIPRTLILIFDGLGMGEISRNFFRPYRGDHTFVGYGIGISVRFIYLIFVFLLFSFSFCLLIFAFCIYLIWPLTGLAALFELLEMGSGSLAEAGIFFLLFSPTLLIFKRNFLDQPKKKIGEIREIGEYQSAMTPVALKIWQKVRKTPYSLAPRSLGGWGPALLLRQFYDYPKMGEVLRRLDFDREKVLERLVITPSSNQTPAVSWDEVLFRAFEIGQQLNHDYIDTDLLFLGLVKADPLVEKVFKEEGLSFEELKMVTRWMEEEKLKRNSWKYWEDKYFHRRTGVDLGWVAGFIPTLKHFSRDITKLIEQGRIPYIVGREEEMEKIVTILSEVTRNNVLLVGPAGVGKTSMVYGIAQKILAGNLSSEGPKVSGKKIISLDLTGLIAATPSRGDLEWRIQETIKEVARGDIILFIDEIEGLVKAGFSEYLSPTLSAGLIQVIGATTPEALRRVIEPNETFVSYFRLVEIAEPTDEEAIEILEGVTHRIEDAHGATITFPAIEAAVKLTRRFIHDRVLPDKAIELLDETAAFKRAKSKKQKTKKLVITDQDIAVVLSDKIKIPIEKITQEESEKLLHLEEILHQRIVGQDQALTALANALRRARSGLTLGVRPLGSFLFIGPTGVGKTESAKALSSAYFGSEQLLRFDMSEFAEHGMVTNFTQRICEAVRSRPFAVVLLDEFEKAEADIHNLFLQIMDDGRLTDLEGKAADFTNVFLIATSNAPDVNLAFRPELLNRFDGIIKFLPLTPEQIVQITRLLLGEVAQKLKEQEIEIEFTDEIVERIAREGFDSQWGARPLRRVIQEKIENKLAEMLLRKELLPGQKFRFEGF